MSSARSYLRPVRVETSPTLRVEVVGGPPLNLNGSQLSPLQVSAWSSAFWAAAIVESRAAYDTELVAERLGVGLLQRAKAAARPSLPTSAGSPAEEEAAQEEELYLLDGGGVDTTGIVQLLQRGSVGGCGWRWVAVGVGRWQSLALVFGGPEHHRISSNPPSMFWFVGSFVLVRSGSCTSRKPPPPAYYSTKYYLTRVP